MLSFKALSEKKTKIKINPKMNDVMEGGFRATAESGMPITMHSYEKGGKVKKAKKVVSEKNHGEDCDCMKCEKKRRSEDVHDGPDVANEEIKMTKKAYNKLHKDFKSDDPKNPRTTKYVPGKGTVSMRVKFVDEAKVDKGRSDYGKASIRNYRRMGPGHDDPGMFDPEGKRGKTIEKRRAEHKARRGVKGAKVPAYKRESFERFVECWKTHKKVGMKMKGGKLVNDCRPKNEEVQVTEGSEKSYYLDKDAEKRAQQKARFKAQNKQAAKERAAAKRRKERNDLRRQGKYGAVGGYYVTKHMEREEVEPKLMSFSEMCCGSVKPVMKTVKPMMKKNELMRNIKKEEAYIKNNTQNIYGSQEEVSEKSDQSITETKTSLARFSDLSEVTRQKKEMGYVKGGTKKPTAPKQKDTALDFVKKQITAKYGKGAIMSGGSKQSKKVKGEKSTVGTGKYKKAADAKKQTAADAKKRGFKSTQDYANTMARYGGKDNYDKGRGLGT